MGANLTIRTGPYSVELITVEWFDRDNLRLSCDIEIDISADSDLELRLNDVSVATVSRKGKQGPGISEQTKPDSSTHRD